MLFAFSLDTDSLISMVEVTCSPASGYMKELTLGGKGNTRKLRVAGRSNTICPRCFDQVASPLRDRVDGALRMGSGYVWLRYSEST